MTQKDVLQITTTKALKTLLAARKAVIAANNTEGAALEAWENARQEQNDSNQQRRKL